MNRILWALFLLLGFTTARAEGQPPLPPGWEGFAREEAARQALKDSAEYFEREQKRRQKESEERRQELEEVGLWITIAVGVVFALVMAWEKVAEEMRKNE